MSAPHSRQRIRCLSFVQAIGRAAVACLSIVLLAAVGCPAPATLNLGISAQEHTLAYFPITDDAVHALGAATVSGPMSCGSCHGGTTSFTVVKCIECHQNDVQPPTAVHSGIAGFLPLNAACLSCHADGTRGSEQGVGDHSLNQFPIDRDDVHGGAAYDARIPAGSSSCTACHASVADRSVVLCAECHANDATPLVDTHAAVLRSFESDSVTCKECHAETPLAAEMRPDDHGGYDMFHKNARCSNCHEARRGPPKEWAIDFATATCTGCHTHPATCAPSNIQPCRLPLPPSP